MDRSKLALYIGLGILFVLYVIIEVNRPKPYSWVPSYLDSDKNPFGAYILSERMPDIFTQGYRQSLQTIYEAKDSTENLLIITKSFDPSTTDMEVLFKELEKGKDVLIATGSFSYAFMDSVGIDLDIHFDNPFRQESDTATFSIEEDTFQFNKSLATANFILGDLSFWRVLGKDEFDRPILIKRFFGKGTLTLSSTPLLFTNYALMQDHGYAERALSELPDEPLHNMMFYHLGKWESQSPFRYILSQESLIWATYLTILTILLIILVNSQRKQRMTPVYEPPVNATIEFIKTMAALFYKQNNHANVGLKLATSQLNQFRRQFYRKPEFTESYYEFIAAKSGVEKATVLKVFDQIYQLQQGTTFNKEQLKSFYTDLKLFK